MQSQLAGIRDMCPRERAKRTWKVFYWIILLIKETLGYSCSSHSTCGIRIIVMSKEEKGFQFLCFDIFFFPLVVDCFVFGLEIWGYVLPLRPPMQTHQRRIGFHGTSNPCGISVPSICYFKLFGFLGWVNKFGLSRKKPQQTTRLIFHLFHRRHLSCKKKRKMCLPFSGQVSQHALSLM